MAVQSPEIVDGTRLGEFFRERVRGAILCEALEVTEITEFYLVDLLTRFERADQLFIPQKDGYEEEPLAVMYAHAICGDTATQIRSLKRLGDKALYTAGFFNEHIKKGPVSIRYYIDMGSSAYSALAGQLVSEHVFAELYSELAENFGGLTKVLNRLSVADQLVSNLELLHLYERYLRSGDESIREALAKEGILPTKIIVKC